MAKHDQKAPTLERTITCVACTSGDCWSCIDVKRAVAFGRDVISLCKCTHPNLEKQLP